jgi:SAM-dependent methyltransferase
MAVPTIKDQLANLINKALITNYISASCKDGIQTGNHYQSVTLGETQTIGFRSDRREFFDQIDFGGKKVLDLGSNLGELSRAARQRGASLVDGFEYDQYFLEIASLLNVYNDVNRVSFFQRDITEPSVYNENYDIVLGFSVFAYIGSLLNEIARITGMAFVLETHKIEGNLEHDYIIPVSSYFPCYKILGESEWTRSWESSENRSVIVFAKTEYLLDSVLRKDKVGSNYSPSENGG